jgi:hypothetical protein
MRHGHQSRQLDAYAVSGSSPPGMSGNQRAAFTDSEREVRGLLLQVVMSGSGSAPSLAASDPAMVADSQPDHHRPWLSVVEAARHSGWPCQNGRAPQSFYDLAKRIGSKVNGKWRIHIDDLDAEIRRMARVTA